MIDCVSLFPDIHDISVKSRWDGSQAAPAAYIGCLCTTQVSSAGRGIRNITGPFNILVIW